MQNRRPKRRPSAQEAWETVQAQASRASESWPVLRLARTLRRLLKAYDQALRPLGLTLQQLHLLCRIATLDHPLAADLAHLLGVGEGTLCRTLGRLEGRSWVWRCHAEMGHALHLMVTAEGRRRLEAGLRAAREIDSSVASILAEDGVHFASEVGLSALMEDDRLCLATEAGASDLLEEDRLRLATEAGASDRLEEDRLCSARDAGASDRLEEDRLRLATEAGASDLLEDDRLRLATEAGASDLMEEHLQQGR